MQAGNLKDEPGYAPEPGGLDRLGLYLPIAIVLTSNLIPLIGVVYWGWDTFVLLMLYWLETLIIAFWTLLRILIGADFSASLVGEVISRAFMFGFFLVHSGGFMLGHFVFLWAFYGKAWSTKIPVSGNLSSLPVEAFWEKMIVANGLLIPLAVSFAGRGVAFAIEMARLPLWQRLVSKASDKGRQAGALVGSLYTRIVIMHLVILGGAALAQKYGALAPLVLLILAKTVVDIWLFIQIDLKGRGATAMDTRKIK
jgi:hypothetical protein